MNRDHWAKQLRFAATEFSITPDEFWKLSLWEWMQLTGSSTSEFMNQQDLQDLVQQFPDTKEAT